MSEQTITNKPEVYYVGPLVISEWIGVNEEPTGVFIGRLQQVLNHPRLNMCYNVRTSDIIKWPDSAGNFETRNTRYVRVYTKPTLKTEVNE